MVPKPKVNILYAGFLDEVFTNYFTSESFKESKYFIQHKKAKVLTENEILEKQQVFSKEWKLHEEKIFKAMHESSGLAFSRNTIDIYLVRVAVRTFASPIIVSGSIATEAFFSLVIHEFLHKLLHEGLGNNFKKLTEITNRLYPNETNSTVLHIPIYAMQFYILSSAFIDGLERINLEKEQAKNFRNQDYTRAIEIVEKIGYQNILDQLKMEMAK